MNEIAMDLSLDKPAASGQTESRVVRGGLVIITALVLVLAVAAILIDRLYQPNAFRFDQIVIQGELNHVDAVEVGSHLKTILKEPSGGNFFSVDMDAMAHTADKFEWIKSATVRRQWPDTMAVTIVEHQPVARWGDQWLTTTGDIIQLPVGTHLPLPQLKGAATEVSTVWKRFQSWSRILSSRGLKLVSLSLTPQHIWELGLTAMSISANPTAFDMTLLEENANAQMNAFIATLNRALIDELPRVEHVDLRYPHGFAVRWKQAEMAE